jgi:hypothetical protein
MFQVTILFSYLQENSGEVYGNVWKVCFDEVNFYVIFGSGRRRLQWLRLQKLQFSVEGVQGLLEYFQIVSNNNR